MPRSPIPDNEPERLEDLRSYRILDSQRDERFDRLAQMAQLYFQTPIALISFIDEDRQWFKSILGMDAVDNPRENAFCAHTIMGDDVMHIPDARADRRFADNPMVTGRPHIRFYAGAPLISPGGFRIGSLGVVDGEPRDLSHRDIKFLQDLAACVVGEVVRPDDEVTRNSLFLNSIIENIPNMVFVKDAKELRFTLFNRAGEELLGMTREEMIGKNDYDFFPKDQADHFVAFDRDVLNNLGPHDIPDEPIDTVANGQRILHTRKIGIRDENDEPQFLLGISEDITERKNIEAELAESLLEAKKANQAKSDFLASMSHELRTPLNAISGLAEMILNEVFGPHASPKYKEYAADIQRSGHHLLSIINDVLDLSRVEAGMVDLDVTTFALNDEIDDCAKLIDARNAPRSGRVETDFSEKVTVLTADVRLFRQILLNLLSNADKFTPDDGRIVVTTARHRGGGVEVKVTDTGAGIPQKDLARVVEPFAQVRENAMMAHDGTGLGLPLAKNLMELHGGTLHIDSQFGEGTEVTLVFPSEAT